MSDERLDRRLTTILAADVVGYSRLMSADESETLRALKRDRAEIIEPKAAEYRGRTIKLMGDGTLMEFASVIDAVAFAVAIQRSIRGRNIDVPAERRISYRVGINIGDVIVEGDDIYGDGVNIAARLEQLADPGGICVARNVFDQVKNKLDLSFADMGDQQLRNISEPVRAYRVVVADDGDAQPGARAGEPLKLPDKPSIAVLPFDNLSGDPEQDYFADGLTEDIITELSRFQSFFVIARHSTYIYKGKAVTVQEVGRELGVHYVAEGSVRKAGRRFRVTVQLIDATNGAHVWAERYDHDVSDIFDLQDAITRAIVAAIPGRLERADLNRIKRKRPEDMAVYDYVLRGKMHHHRGTREDNSEALRLLDQAIEMDPDFAEAYAWKACTLGQALARGFGDNKEELFAQDVAAVEKALSLDDSNFECHWIMCEVRMMVGRLEEAELHHQKAFDLNSNDPRVVVQRSELLTWLGRAEEGVHWARQAMRLDPYNAAGRAHLLGRALYMARRHAEAIEAFKQVRTPSFRCLAEAAACHAELGSDAAASRAAAKVLELKPDFTIADHVSGLPFKDSSDREQYRDGLRKAGLPEGT